MKKINKTAALLAVILALFMCFSVGVSAEGEVTEPEAPETEQVVLTAPETVTSVVTDSSITLNWDAVENATGYRIFYKTASGWTTCATSINTTFTFSSLEPGMKFTYAVRPYSDVDGVFTWAPAYTVHDTATQPSAPEKVVSAYNASAIKLSWSAAKGATGYRVYYTTGDSWKIAVKSTTATTCTFTGLKPGSKFCFAVRPYFYANSIVWGDYTTHIATTTPATPAVQVSSPGVGQISLFWNAVRGADGYAVYYKLNNGSYKLYKIYRNASNLHFYNLNGGDTYTFAVRAGIKTTAGNVWSGYQQKPVRLAYRITRYLDAVKKGTYYIETHDGEGLYESVAIKNGSFCVKMEYDGEVNRVVYNKNNKKVYDIYDSEKQYIVVDDDGTFASMASELSGLDLNTKIKIATKETVNGRTYFTETAVLEGGIIDKYYFSGATLVMEELSYQGESVMIYYSRFTNNVPDSLFRIPSDYTKVDYDDDYDDGYGDDYDDGYYYGVYMTPTGTKYHFDPDCGGANSFETTL